MGFYQAMQLSAANLKPLIKNAESKEIKNKYIAALILKSIGYIELLIASIAIFAIVILSIVNTIKPISNK